MLLTHEEAGKKWCPHSRQAVDTSRDAIVSTTANRDSKSHYGIQNCECIASECALWVEIDPGKGVMGCNPVMAEWAITELHQRQLVKDGVMVETPAYKTVMVGDQNAHVLVDPVSRLSTLVVQTTHPIPGEVVVDNGPARCRYAQVDKLSDDLFARPLEERKSVKQGLMVRMPDGAGSVIKDGVQVIIDDCNRDSLISVSEMKPGTIYTSGPRHNYEMWVVSKTGVSVSLRTGDVYQIESALGYVVKGPGQRC